MGDAHLRTIGVVSTARSDYGIYRPLLTAITREPALRLHLIAGGMHLSPEFGHSITQIENDGFPIADRVELLLSSDTPLGTAKSMALGVMGFAESFNRARPDLLVVLGDRFEMHAAALASLPFGIPLAHIHGGEVTEGAIDDSLRHGITKIAHLHFTSTQAYAQRVMRLGEEPWRVTVSGAPSLDNLATEILLTKEELEKRFNIELTRPPLLVTFHPVTREIDRIGEQVDALLGALSQTSEPIIITMPNADTGGRLVAERIRAFAGANSRAVILDNLGTQAYFSMMNISAAMIGNSSSGIIEAASFGLPVVNIGTRQAGRIRGSNVIDVLDGKDAIVDGIQRALLPAFRASLQERRNPYGAGNASEVIVSRLRDVALDERLLHKRFFDG